MRPRSARVAGTIVALNKLLGDAEDQFTLREMHALVEYIEGEFLETAQQAEWAAQLDPELDRRRR
jgi:hypothetical protein